MDGVKTDGRLKTIIGGSRLLNIFRNSRERRLVKVAIL